MIVLGVAYALFEEGLVTQFLFNPSYHGLDLQSAAYIPALGIGAQLTVTVIALHAIWSTGVAIALAEALVPARSTTPWLGTLGLAITGIVFLAGSAFLFEAEYSEQDFLASVPQLVGTTVVILALIAAAFAIGRRPRPRLGNGAQPVAGRGGVPGRVEPAPERRGRARLGRGRDRARPDRERPPSWFYGGRAARVGVPRTGSRWPGARC